MFISLVSKRLVLWLNDVPNINLTTWLLQCSCFSHGATVSSCVLSQVITLPHWHYATGYRQNNQIHIEKHQIHDSVPTNAFPSVDLDHEVGSQGYPSGVEADRYESDYEAYAPAYSHDFWAAWGAEGGKGAATEAGGDDHDGDYDACGLGGGVRCEVMMRVWWEGGREGRGEGGREGYMKFGYVLGSASFWQLENSTHVVLHTAALVVLADMHVFLCTYYTYTPHVMFNCILSVYIVCLHTHHPAV